MSGIAYFSHSEPCMDFSSFIAASRGISSGEAEMLLENWLTEYESQERRPIRVMRSADEISSGA